MNLFIRSARILDPTSSYHLQTRDIVIEKGVITRIGSRLHNTYGYREITSPGLCVSPGWVDLFAFLGDPGYEHKEDLFTGIAAAASGGFTTVCCMPNTRPPLHSKTEVEYVINKCRNTVVEVKPIGAVSRNCEGTQITEIYDMYEAGAVAFSDGIQSCISAGLTLRALLYIKPFDGLFISHPDDQSIRGSGLVNEGATSTMMGIPGIPAIAEELMVLRDLFLAEYAGSRIHFAYVSSPGSLEHIRKAKAKGLRVSCAVAPYNLLLDESAALEFDTNYKVLPPLKTQKDIKALVKGIQDGVIDVLSSMHIPQDTESKKVEFDLAEFGMTGLETAYAVANTACCGLISDERIVQMLAITPRTILNLPVPTIKKGNHANLTVFDNSLKWVFEEKNIRSKSRNTPFLGREFTGKVLAVVNNNQLFQNP
ncbi:MAG: dihydroorotase [Chitinophagales bacterium]|nr:MAG: dihydroorotase [Chitinophagales bacterium]